MTYVLVTYFPPITDIMQCDERYLLVSMCYKLIKGKDCRTQGEGRGERDRYYAVGVQVLACLMCFKEH